MEGDSSTKKKFILYLFYVTYIKKQYSIVISSSSSFNGWCKQQLKPDCPGQK